MNLCSWELCGEERHILIRQLNSAKNFDHYILFFTVPYSVTVLYKRQHSLTLNEINIRIDENFVRNFLLNSIRQCKFDNTSRQSHSFEVLFLEFCSFKNYQKIPVYQTLLLSCIITRRTILARSPRSPLGSTASQLPKVGSQLDPSPRTLPYPRPWDAVL